VDVESFAADVEKSYTHDLVQIYGFEVKDKDADKLYLYHTLNHIINCFKNSDNRKNVILYINSNTPIGFRFLKVLEKIRKTFPVVVYTNTLDFNCLEQTSGCYNELTLLIKEFRFNFDFNKFSPRKMKAFLDKYQIKLTFPI
jgi:hypothetical protein